MSTKGSESDITWEMIDAGSNLLPDCCQVLDRDWLVEEIYTAMEGARLKGCNQAERDLVPSAPEGANSTP